MTIRDRTEKKELRLSRDLVLSREEWLLRGGIYRGSLGNAAREGFYTARECERMGLPVTDEEFLVVKDFAMFKNCYTHNCLVRENKKVRPCLPVFKRNVPTNVGTKID